MFSQPEDLVESMLTISLLSTIFNFNTHTIKISPKKSLRVKTAFIIIFGFQIFFLALNNCSV